MDAQTLFSIGLALIFSGIIIIFAVTLLLFLHNVKGEGRARGGGAIIVGPFPIVFGTDKESVRTILLLSIILTILLAIITVVFYLLLR
ncbi:MAG: DUF131 domain-containing protein [Candidatus Bathyarchaeia archaeon]